MISLADRAWQLLTELSTLTDACEILDIPLTQDAYNQEVEGNATVVATPRCAFDSGVRVEQRGAERTVVQTGARFWVPPDTPVHMNQAVRYRDELYPISGLPPIGTYGRPLQAILVEEVS